MPFDVRADFVRITGDTVLMPVTIQVKNRDITFANKEGVQRGLVNMFGRITTITGRVAQTFEDTVKVDVPSRSSSRRSRTTRFIGRPCRCVRGCTRWISF